MAGLTIYPRGFTAGSAEAGPVEISDGCPGADNLFNLFGHAQGNPVDMSYYDALFGYAMQQFGDFETWLDLQLSNRKLEGPKMEYIIETVDFALRGQPRAMSQYSWSFLLTPEIGPVKRDIPSRLYLTKRYLEPNISTAQVLQRWCSQAQGAQDLLLTLHVLFGHVGRTPA